MPAVGQFAEYLVAAGVVEVAFGADHIQSPPERKKFYITVIFGEYITSAC